MNEKIHAIKTEIAKVMVGQEALIDALLIGLITDGHILVEGVPGLAKTTAINSLAKALGLDFKRVQFTPDLLPSDIVGTEMYDQRNGAFKVKMGPAFTHLLLADEINRAPAKVQSALLEVMQEHQITIGDETFKLSDPFLVLATQNPVEQEGTYRLPEAQLDRFMLKVLVDYNSFEEEMQIVDRIANRSVGAILQVAGADDILAMRDEVQNVHVDEAVTRYMMKIIFATREPEKYGVGEIAQYLEYGASPRASINLYKAAKARAYLRGNDFVTPLDVADTVRGVLRHRMVLNYRAEAAGVTADDLIGTIMQTIKLP
ncbi:AAA family ATPase [Sulfurimonas sp. HSL-3221]|uniref:AAA family ATPase n=1 Tax=Sulfurimonadaceae TaxID=2771471 RepID=UPI001E468AE5|nr:AAA family ATPase [Sulfurimonas sp. HSL-3221]UFS62803.1 AAA family ATPase [Sulfurimonas sp. HSL-3221]